MRLSEAIVLGAMLGPQGTGGDMSKGRRCALAGVAVVIGYGSFHGYCPYQQLRRVFPILSAIVEAPPEIGVYRDEVMSIIWQLNDSQKWTREEIAQWVQEIEVKHELGAVSATEGVAVSCSVLTPELSHVGS